MRITIKITSAFLFIVSIAAFCFAQTSPDKSKTPNGYHLLKKIQIGGEGTLTVIREDSADKFSVVENVATQRGARTMTLDTKTNRIYLATAAFGETPAPTAERPHPRPSIVPDSFVVLVFGK